MFNKKLKQDVAALQTAVMEMHPVLVDLSSDLMIMREQMDGMQQALLELIAKNGGCKCKTSTKKCVKKESLKKEKKNYKKSH